LIKHQFKLFENGNKLEYIWLDGYKPIQSLRSKTKIAKDFSGNLEDCPMWSFDGSSTQQAEGNASDCLLNPCAIFPDPGRRNAFLVMCEVLNADGTAHPSNGRATIDDDDNDFWFGFEQEYFLWNLDTDKPLGFPANGYPNPQGQYYCSVGAANAFGRELIEEHLDLCIDAGINIEGINAEVAAGQWEFQVFAKGAQASGDQVWVARYLLERTLRNAGNKAAYEHVCEAFRPVVKKHIAVYGPDNHLRLTGLHETQAIDQFSYGVSDRGASIRIPIATVENGWKGWLEDRRPNSAADPYKVAAVIINTVNSSVLEPVG